MHVYWSSREKSNKGGIVCSLLETEIFQSCLPVQDLTAIDMEHQLNYVLFWEQTRKQQIVGFEV